MHLTDLHSGVTDASERLLEAAKQPGSFAAAFDACSGEEIMAFMADLAQLARLAATLVELIGDRYRGDD